MEMEAANLLVPVWPQLVWSVLGLGGNVWASYITAISRNPASRKIGANIWIGFAVTEAIALFALIVALIACLGNWLHCKQPILWGLCPKSWACNLFA